MQLQSLAELLKVLALPKRIEIVDLLKTVVDGLPVVTIASLIGLNDSRTSEHLNRMAQSGIVLRTTQGRYVFYSLNRDLMFQVFSYFQLKELSHDKSS